MTKLKRGTPEEAGMLPGQIELIKRRGAEWVEQDNTMALVVLAARHGVVCLHEAWGPLNGKPDAPPAQLDSYFPWASMGKAATAVAAMQLVEAGELGLTRPLRFYIPELAGAGSEEVLVQHLLTHTSGYDDDEDVAWTAARLAEGMELPDCPASQHEMIHAQLHARYTLPVATRPGTLMCYASINTDLLGEVLRRISGVSHADLLSERIFKPLGMTRTSVGFDPIIEPNLVADFDTQVMDFPTGDAARAMLSLPLASGGVLGSIEDCAVFAQMLLNGGSYGDATILQPATVAQMTRNQIPGIGANFAGHLHREASWGYGLNIVDTDRWRWFDGALPSNGAFGHSGAGGVLFWADPAYDLIGLYFSRCLDIDPETFEHHWDGDLYQNMVTAAVAD
jgi:CubicO group peptidase (beta-lactamase class C family)